MNLIHPKLTVECSRELRDSFKSIVTELSIANAHSKEWWYTWLSSRDRTNSILWSKLEAGIRSKLLLIQTADKVEISINDPLVADLIKENAITLGWNTIIKNSDKIRWLICKTKRKMKLINRNFKFLGNGLWWCLASRLNRSATKNKFKLLDYIFISIADLETLNSKEPFIDHYFGQLPNKLASKGKKVCVVFIPTGNPTSICRALSRKKSDVSLIPIAQFIKPLDLLKYFLLSLIGININNQIPRLSNAQKKIVKEDIKLSAGPITINKSIEHAMKDILNHSPNAKIIHIYENNPWERAIANAAKDGSIKHELKGYLHCAVLESHFKNFIASEELNLRPGPDQIICTGPAARKLFLKLGNHDPKNVTAGCALRGQDILSLPLRDIPPKKITKIIVIMEGLSSMVKLLKFIDEAANIYTHVDFELREHPALPISTLVKDAGIKINNHSNLNLSRNGKLEEVLKDYDIAIYQGTTAAMVAVAMGLPVIKLNLEESVNDDPLINCIFLKKIVNRPEELESAFTYFENMSHDIFQQEAKDARNYIQDYMTPPSSNTLLPFVQKAKNL